jgi:hypothetical protein
MIVNKLEPKQALKKEYLKVKPDRESFAAFKVHLARLLDLCDSQKDEEFNKNLLSDFLKKSFYGDRYFINTKGKSELALAFAHPSMVLLKAMMIVNLSEAILHTWREKQFKFIRSNFK